MKKINKCRNCQSELIFHQMPEEFTHDWKAVCSKCYSKDGQPLFNKWVNDKTMSSILNEYPQTEFYLFKEPVQNNEHRLSIAQRLDAIRRWKLFRESL